MIGALGGDWRAGRRLARWAATGALGGDWRWAAIGAIGALGGDWRTGR
ncbi:MAG: hypothetical protein IT359_08645 [Gemmatimonadaceae bacterium]|nr:hypothetical protein [Gemmatimonadaceae bacterium]